MTTKKVNIFWFRRDLRLEDNTGLYEALNEDLPVLPIFIFDTEILENLPETDARVSFIYKTLQKMRETLQQECEGSIGLYHGKPSEIFEKLTEEYSVKTVFTNRDYEPYARERDREIAEILSAKKVALSSFKDQVIFEKDEITKKDGDPYVVYTPYMKLWKQKLQNPDLKNHEIKPLLKNLVKNSQLPNLSLDEIGFTKSSIEVPDYDVTSPLLQQYKERRDFPAQNGTSRIGPHLRFGTVSIRQIVGAANTKRNATFLEELIWREFFMQILYHYPHTVTNAFKAKYDRIEWRNNKDEFQKWKEGKTGYPLVDAGMRQLNQTGFMHNRVRMLVASFLCKHLLIDWRWGEAYFAEKLLDYEMASNVGNWQWAAGSGVDAAPYFRIFNPTTQIKKFDRDHTYIMEWVEEFGTDRYPDEIVEHKEARERALKIYKAAVSG